MGLVRDRRFSLTAELRSFAQLECKHCNVEHRRHKGFFKSVDELASVQKYENRELRFRALLVEGIPELELRKA